MSAAQSWSPYAVDLTECGDTQPTWIEWVTTEMVRIAVGSERAAYVVTWSALDDLAAQQDADTAAIYQRVRQVARRRLADVERAAERARIEECPGHVTVERRDRAFSGPVGRPEEQNPAAHGCITIVESCRCGAERHTNVNGRHVERGEWS